MSLLFLTRFIFLLYFRPLCDSFGSDYSIVVIKIRIIYPIACDHSLCCKQAFDNCIQSQFTTFMPSLILKFKFDDGTSKDLVLSICQNPTHIWPSTTSRMTSTGKNIFYLLR